MFKHKKMKKVLRAIVFTLLANMVVSCSEEEKIGGPARIPIAEKDIRHTVQVGDIVTLKSNEQAFVLIVPTFVPYDDKEPMPIDRNAAYPRSIRHHWIECCQTDAETFVFKVYEPEPTDTVTYMNANFQTAPPYVGESIVTFYLKKTN